MAKDIRTLFKDSHTLSNDTMPVNHETRFLKKLDKVLPVETKPKFNWIKLAASVVLFLGLGYGATQFVNFNNITSEVVNTDINNEIETKTLGDISPDLKKIEDYYVANINIELSKIKLTPKNKELFDSYVSQLESLKKEYTNLSLELTKNGPDELTIDALINNLKFRLNLMYRLKQQLKNLNAIEAAQV